MGKLCFGSYAKILQKSIREPNSQRRVAELLLGLITDNEFVTNQDGEPFVVTDKLASELFGCKRNMLKKIKEAASSLKIIDAANDYFYDVVMPEIMPDMIPDLLFELSELISSDNKLSTQKKDELLCLATPDTISSFLSDLFLYTVKKPNKLLSDPPATPLNCGIPSVLDDAEKLKSLLEKIHPTHPSTLTPPEEIESNEMVYVTELLSAYADAENLDELSKESLSSYPKYKMDFERRRKDYYAAESIRRGSRDIFGETDPDQFSVLKNETYDGIIDVYSNNYPHGFARLNGVMAQAAVIRVDKCLLSRLPDWIGASEKKGVCHILVNEGKIKGWVESDE